MEPRFENQATMAEAGMPMQYTGDRPRAVMNEKCEEFTATRKHELIMLAESIVEQVKAAKARGRERCFLKSMVELLLES